MLLDKKDNQEKNEIQKIIEEIKKKDNFGETEVKKFAFPDDCQKPNGCDTWADKIAKSLGSKMKTAQLRKVFNSIKKGFIDVPFSPHIINANEVITLRDAKNSIRIFKKGSLPISDKCFKYEKANISLKKSKNAIVDKIVKDIGIML